MAQPEQERSSEWIDEHPEDTAPYFYPFMLFDLVKNGSVDIPFWLALGANPNEQDQEGMTPLHHAAALGSRVCIRALVNSGKCDYLIRDNRGRYAFELAIEWARDYAVARLLMKKQLQQAHAQGVPAYIPRR